jgi:hypothetical protein
MLRSLSIRYFFLVAALFFGCTEEFPAIGVKETKDARWTEKNLIIYKNGKVLKVISNEMTYPPELQFELNAMVSFDIDSSKRIIYVNNFAKDLLAISVDDGQVLHKSSLERAYTYSENTYGRLRGKVFHIKKYRDKVLLITDWDVLVYNEELQLQKKLLDSVAVKNPRLTKGFIGSFDYALEGDSIKLIYNIESYLYGLNDLEKPVIVDEHSFKL